MASRYEIEVKISSAKNLKNVNWRNGPNRPYAVVWVDPTNKCSTRADDEAVWDETLRFALPPSSGPIDDFTLYIDVVHAVTGSEAENTKPLIGSARLKLRDILEDSGINGDRVFRSLTLKRPSGRPQGEVDVRVSIRDLGYRAPGSYYAAAPYGVPPPSRDFSGYNYGAPAPPPTAAYGQQSYNYGAAAATPSGYAYGGGYNEAQPGTAAYGQPATVAYGGGYEEKKKSKFGGMGTGLAVGAVAGVLGGLALGEGVEALEDHIADKAAEKEEEDEGFGDDYDEEGDDF